MTTIKNQIYDGVVVPVDGYQYFDCAFTRCQLVFTGLSMPQFVKCDTTDCAWVFTGPAQNMLSFLTGVYSSGPAGKALVDSIVQSIRNGPPSQPAAVPQPDTSGGKVN